MKSLSILITLAFRHVLAARFLHSIPEDTYAFPKYRVTFLNGLPLSNDTANRWLKDGLRGGELEFLDQPWQEEVSSPKEIGSGDLKESSPVASSHSLELMKMGQRDSYLCFIPKPVDSLPHAPEEEPDTDVTPVRSWSLLQPLSGTCLYHRQGWFTYSYCHNQEIRQFKELINAQPHAPGGYKPEEDTEWEAYTLGKAPATPEPGADLTVAEQNALAANLELAHSAGSRYLVQRWGDGTVCDKTGKRREVEVQFHCSMTVTDTILFVKEAKTCSYVLVIHTPRLCGEPGFKSRLDAREEAYIRCREVVDPAHAEHGTLPEAEHPFKLPRRKPKPVLSAPPATGAADGEPARGRTEQYGEMLRKALETLMGAAPVRDGEFPQVVVERLGDDGDVVIEFLDDFPAGEGEGVGEVMHDALANALRKAGFDVKGEKIKGDEGDENGDKREKMGDDAR